MNGTCKSSGTPLKDQTLWIMGIAEKEVQIKSTENIFNKIIAEMSPILTNSHPMDKIRKGIL
jgi:hypothetical protein